MCNCGKRRSQLKQQPVVFNKINTDAKQPLQNNAPVLFQYTGNTALTVTGSITRKNYRFHFSGDKQFIEYNDAPAMMAVPVLKKVS